MNASTTEIDLLYLMSNQLVQASTPQQQLDAVSDYALLHGATQGVLFYIENPEHDPVQWAMVSAEWLTDEKHRLGVGERFETLQLSFLKNIFSYPIQPFLIEDMLSRDDVDAPLMDIFTAHHVRGTAILPLNNNGRWIGLLWFTWDTPHRFTRQDAQMYTAMLQQAAPIIDSRRLLEQRSQRTLELEGAYQELDLLYRTGELINRANTYEEIIEAVAHFDPQADVVSLMLWENLDWASANYLDIVAVIDRAGNSLVSTGDRLHKADFPVAQSMMGSQVWDFTDTQNDPRADQITRDSWKSLNILSFFGTALYIDDRWLGGATFHSNQPRPFTERQKRLLAGIGDMVLGAVERIRLKQETEMALRSFTVLEERNRLARELHDSVSQALYGIVLSMKTAQVQLERSPQQLSGSLDYALSLSQAALSEMRALIFELRPETLEKEGLVEALNRQFEMIAVRYGLIVSQQIRAEPSIPLSQKEHVYWIAREALHNVIKHARATRVMVRLDCDDHTLTLQIVDDGTGFDTARDFTGHLGLRSMSERTARLGGVLTVSSQHGSGTTITLTAPIRTANP